MEMHSKNVAASLLGSIHIERFALLASAVGDDSGRVYTTHQRGEKAPFSS